MSLKKRNLDKNLDASQGIPSPVFKTVVTKSSFSSALSTDGLIAGAVFQPVRQMDGWELDPETREIRKELQDTTNHNDSSSDMYIVHLVACYLEGVSN